MITFNRHLCSQLLNLVLSFLLLFLSSLAFLALLWLVSCQSGSEIFECFLFFNSFWNFDVKNMRSAIDQNVSQCLQA